MITSADIKRVRNKLGLTQNDFGRLMGVGQNSISDYETGKAIPSKTFIEYFKYRYIDNSSLSTVDSRSKIEKKVKKAAVKYSNDLNYLLEMTQEILTSDTDYAESLAANIKAFYKSVINEKRLNSMYEHTFCVAINIKLHFSIIICYPYQKRRRYVRRIKFRFLVLFNWPFGFQFHPIDYSLLSKTS